MAVQLAKLPLSATPQTFNLEIIDTQYNLRFVYADALDGGWLMDIRDAEGTAILCGMPLVTGTNLLAQYAYLGFHAAFLVITESDPPRVPTFTNLGMDANVYLATEV